MYTFVFHYESGSKFPFRGVERVSFNHSNGLIELDGQQILSHNFRTDINYYLHSKDFTVSVSCNNLRFIEVVKD